MGDKMKGKLIDLSFGMNRKQRVTVELDGDFRADFDRLHDAPVRVEIKKYKPRRSLDANAYAWVLIDKLAAALRITKEEVYRQAIREIGGVSFTGCFLDEAVDTLCDCWQRKGIGRG
jgi:hypothetical protein